MTFDPCQHQITQLILKAGALRRKELGLPEEMNVTTLYNETAPLLGFAPRLMSSKDVGHLPAPHEMTKEDGTFVVPRKDCPECGGKESMILGPLCSSCADAKDEDGKIRYRTMWQCQECKFKEKSEKFLVVWLNELGVEIPNGMKKALGIRIFTDNGMK